MTLDRSRYTSRLKRERDPHGYSAHFKFLYNLLTVYNYVSIFGQQFKKKKFSTQKKMHKMFLFYLYFDRT